MSTVVAEDCTFSQTIFSVSEVEKIRAENTALKAEIENLENRLDVVGQRGRNAMSECDALKALVSELMKAAEPFVNIHDKGAYPDAMRLQHTVSPFTYGDLRSLSEAVARAKKEVK